MSATELPSPGETTTWGADPLVVAARVEVPGDAERVLDRLRVEHPATAFLTVLTVPTLDDLAMRIGELRGLVEAEGRDWSTISVQVDGLLSFEAAADDPGRTLGLVEQLAGLGVTDLLLRPPHDASAVDVVSAFGQQVITQAR